MLGVFWCVNFTCSFSFSSSPLLPKPPLQFTIYCQSVFISPYYCQSVFISPYYCQSIFISPLLSKSPQQKESSVWFETWPWPSWREYLGQVPVHWGHVTGPDKCASPAARRMHGCGLQRLDAAFCTFAVLYTTMAGFPVNYVFWGGALLGRGGGHVCTIATHCLWGMASFGGEDTPLRHPIGKHPEWFVAQVCQTPLPGVFIYSRMHTWWFCVHGWSRELPSLF